MPPRQPDISAQLAALNARFDALEKYEHDWRHEQAQRFQPLFLLPERITRDNAELKGAIPGQIAAAVTNALQPVLQDVAALKQDVAELKGARSQLTGVQLFSAWLVKTVLAAALALAALLALKAKP